LGWRECHPPWPPTALSTLPGTGQGTATVACCVIQETDPPVAIRSFSYDTADGSTVVLSTRYDGASNRRARGR